MRQGRFGFAEEQGQAGAFSRPSDAPGLDFGGPGGIGSLPALSVRQPWAWAIEQGHKPIENRTWTTSYRGPLIIHASSSRDSLGEGRGVLPEYVPAEELIFGALICVVQLVDVVPLARVRSNPYAEGPWCWLLEDVRRIRPIRMPGKQGLFRVGSEYEER